MMMMSVIVTVTVTMHVIEQEDGAAAAASTLIGVPAATSTFTPHVLPYRPPWNLKF